MKIFFLLIGLMVTVPGFTDQSVKTEDTTLVPYRQSLHNARENYRQNVRSHGAQSREAAQARAQLHASRRAFHSQRRTTRL